MWGNIPWEVRGHSPPWKLSSLLGQTHSKPLHDNFAGCSVPSALGWSGGRAGSELFSVLKARGVGAARQCDSHTSCQPTRPPHEGSVGHVPGTEPASQGHRSGWAGRTSVFSSSLAHGLPG